jgi:hypothetical protein
MLSELKTCLRKVQEEEGESIPETMEEVSEEPMMEPEIEEEEPAKTGLMARV